MDSEPTPPDTFHQFDLSLWKRSKIAHITLVSIGTLLMIPACFVLVSIAIAIQRGMYPLIGEFFLHFLAAIAATTSCGFAWCALCLLFFKRCDAQWQRISWTICAISGYITFPATLLWIGTMIKESGNPMHPTLLAWMLLLFFILGIAIVCILLGHRYSRFAIHSLRR